MAFPRPADKTGMEAMAAKSEKRAPLFSRKGAPAPSLMVAIGGPAGGSPPKGPAPEETGPPEASETPALAQMQARLDKMEAWCKSMGMDAEESEPPMSESESPEEEASYDEEAD
jgi:hypothetical protein